MRSRTDSAALNRLRATHDAANGATVAHLEWLHRSGIDSPIDADRVRRRIAKFPDTYAQKVT